MKRFLQCIFVLSFIGCTNENEEELSQNQPFFFEDSFEVANNELDDLFPLDGSRWTLIQQANPIGATNEMSIVDDPISDGMDALRILSNPSNEILSKIDIEKVGFEAYKGNTVTISADFFIATEEPLTDLFLIDLECCSCWDPSVSLETSGDADNQCPGVRLKISGDGFLSIERGKISDTTIQQTSTAFPRNQWVTIEWTMELSDQPDGMNRLKLDGNEVIAQIGMNLPNAEIFSQVFAENDIDFTLQEPVFYERVQVGATANPNAGAIELFVDNFSLSIEQE